MNIKLNDKYVLDKGVRFLTGIQALVRLPIVQLRRDKKNNLKTACYISGYRGSPLGEYDQELTKNLKYLNSYDIRFQPGINEELAATSIWGSQQLNLYEQSKYDGVCGIWYGKGPGIDRSGDALKHANHAGTSKFGGVLALMGDDHICQSSTNPHQGEFAMIDAMIPIFNPSGVQEILDYGLYGFHLSRISGSWIGIKCEHDNVGSSATVDLNENRFSILNINNSFFPEDGLNIRKFDTPAAREHRLHYFKINAVKEFCRINNLNNIIINPNSAKIGIVSSGKSFLDTKLALKKLGIEDSFAKEKGIRLLKIAMPWPLEETIIHEFSKDLEIIIVIEEKRSLIENQIKDILFNNKSNVNIIGKLDLERNNLFLSSGSLDPSEIALKLGKFLYKQYNFDFLEPNIKKIENIINSKKNPININRTPYFCSGCPHNTSTKVPEDSRAITGISCAYLVTTMERNNHGFTQMGSEGATWVGESVFSSRDHVFQNMGDGTYIHSGILSIRHAIASKTKMTFKILYNDAVALTGGQPLDGLPTVEQISKQLEAEGVKEIAIISDEPNKYKDKNLFSKNSKIYHRKDIIRVQKELSNINDTTIIIYDQTCAAEKRRKIKRSILPEPNKKIFINEDVCEGCGDCGIQSNCVSIIPLETEFGRKRQIDQSNCNKDYSCVEGFCPSFVSLVGDVKLKSNLDNSLLEKMDLNIPEPNLPHIEDSYGIMIAGIGGTGVLTIGAILATAAQIDGKGSGVLDKSGLSQKGGAVKSFIRIFNNPLNQKTIRLSYGDANLLLGCDLLVSNDNEIIKTLDISKTKSIINSDEVMTGEFTRDKNFTLPFDKMKENLINFLGENNITFLPTATIANKLLGNSIFSNMIVVGYAYQAGLIPINSKCIEQAITLNGVSIDKNIKAFKIGRCLLNNKAEVLKSISSKKYISSNLDEKIEYRYNFLIKYQNENYAKKYKELIDYVRVIEKKLNIEKNDLTEAVANNYFKLMSYKDEYEVARLYSNKEFVNKIKNNFEGNFNINFHLSPPIFFKKDSHTGKPLKMKFGSWFFIVFRILNFFKFIRGTFFDPFNYLHERKIERKLIEEYQIKIRDIVSRLTTYNYKTAVEIASIPDQIRGFGYIKKKNIEIAKNCEDELMSTFNE